MTPRSLATAARAAVVAGLAASLAGLVWASAPVAPDGNWVPRDELAADPTALVPDDALRDLLGGVDYIPGRADLDPLLGDEPTGVLIELATTDDLDPGVRLRALRGLADYPGEATVGALTTAIEALRASESGADLLYLSAALQSLAAVAGEDAVDAVRPVLDHVSKDARAAAARALGATGAQAAKKWLYERFGVELDPMVRLALGDAIRALDENQ